MAYIVRRVQTHRAFVFVETICNVDASTSKDVACVDLLRTPAGNIDLIIDTREMYIELDYRFGDEPRHYRVQLVSVPSNLGKGRIWYFLCPQTSKRCRILYGVEGWFFHRSAFRGCCYDRQTLSKQYRLLDYTIFPRQIEINEQLRKCRKTYRGKPTRRYQNLIRRLGKCDDMQRAISRSWAGLLQK